MFQLWYVTFQKKTLYLYLHTDRSGLQLSKVFTKNYSTAPRVPMGILGLVCDPRTRFSGLVLNHQGLEELELKNHLKTAVFDQIWLFLSGFLFWFF